MGIGRAPGYGMTLAQATKKLQDQDKMIAGLLRKVEELTSELNTLKEQAPESSETDQ